MNLDCPTCEGKVESLRGFSLATPSARSAGPSGVAASAAAGALPPRAERGPAMRMATAAASAPTKRVSAGDLMITFKLGSSELTDEGAANARNFANALNDPRLANQGFLIIGHTDATGSADRNLVLSEQRAGAVKAFLVKQGIEAGRLQTKGLGSQDLAVPSAPAAAANRRVEVKRAG
jgi:outer membrane protein OmpA-like peptidoglycan-associated protein